MDPRDGVSLEPDCALFRVELGGDEAIRDSELLAEELDGRTFPLFGAGLGGIETVLDFTLFELGVLWAERDLAPMRAEDGGDDAVRAFPTLRLEVGRVKVDRSADGVETSLAPSAMFRKEIQRGTERPRASLTGDAK